MLTVVTAALVTGESGKWLTPETSKLELRVN